MSNVAYGTVGKIITGKKLCPPEAYPVIAMTSGAVLLSMGMLWHTWVPHEETVFNKTKPYSWLGSEPLTLKDKKQD